MQTNAAIEILADLPGVPKHLLQVTLEKSSLTIQVHTIVPECICTPCSSHASQDTLGLDDSTFHRAAGCSATTDAVSRGSACQLDIVKSAKDDDSSRSGSRGAERRCLQQNRYHTKSYWAPVRTVLINERPRSVSMARTLQLPANTDAASADARLADRVLRITISKNAGPRSLRIA